MAKALFGAGCFWGVEDFFRQVPGVEDAISGYAGGHVNDPTYRQVCSGMTNHAEVVEVTYDPARVDYGHLVDVFFANHDPTQFNRQGPDIGSQYRSVIFTYGDDQAVVADARKAALIAAGTKVVTVIEPAPTFWAAEEYHQRYFEKNGLPSCHLRQS